MAGGARPDDAGTGPERQERDHDQATFGAARAAALARGGEREWARRTWWAAWA
jgi:hypothetical protein